VGSIPTGFIIANRFAGINIQDYGSGNIGATNMTRILGKKLGILTLLGDGLKAFFYTVSIKYFYPEARIILCLGALAVLLGNCFSLFLHFKGGKGGVTTYGVFLALTPWAIISVIAYIIMLVRFKNSALGTLTSEFILPWVIFFFLPGSEIKAYYLGLSVCFLIIVWARHSSNIKELLRGGNSK
jgi:glycerol-3-phosphate acyltransferase PlsY